MVHPYNRCYLSLDNNRTTKVLRFHESVKGRADFVGFFLRVPAMSYERSRCAGSGYGAVRAGICIAFPEKGCIFFILMTNDKENQACIFQTVI